MSIYDRINNLCKEKYITGKELGEKLGLKKSPLTDWKNNKSKPTIEQIKMICEIFATSADYLLFGKDTNELTQNEKEMLNLYKQLPEREQIKFIGKIEDVLYENTKNIEKSSDSQAG